MTADTKYDYCTSRKQQNNNKKNKIAGGGGRRQEGRKHTPSSLVLFVPQIKRSRGVAYDKVSVLLRWIKELMATKTHHTSGTLKASKWKQTRSDKPDAAQSNTPYKTLMLHRERQSFKEMNLMMISRKLWWMKYLRHHYEINFPVHFSRRNSHCEPLDVSANYRGERWSCWRP